MAFIGRGSLAIKSRGKASKAYTDRAYRGGAYINKTYTDRTAF